MTPPGRVVKAVAKYVAAHPGCSRQDARVGTGASDVAIDKAVDHGLVRERQTPMGFSSSLWPPGQDSDIDLHGSATANY